MKYIDLQTTTKQRLLLLGTGFVMAVVVWGTVKLGIWLLNQRSDLSVLGGIMLFVAVPVIFIPLFGKVFNRILRKDVTNA